MTKTTLVSSITESTGKTASTIALARLAKRRGEAVGYMKPKGTRLQSNVGKTTDADPMLAHELLDLEEDVATMTPIVYSPTFIEQAIRGREDPDALRERVQECYDEIAEERDRVFVEGGGQLTTGGIIDMTDVDLAEQFDAEVVVLTRFEQASDVDDILAAEDLLGDRLKGVLFNAVADTVSEKLDADVVPFLERRGIDVHGIVPRDHELAGITIGDLAEELGASVLTDGPTDGYVERFSVGAMGSDEALRHFRRTKDAAVITGGDRSEIQTVALEAPGIKALILTGGHRPSSAVIGKAEEKAVPILLVQTDTLTAVERAEDVVRSGRTRNEATVDRIEELLHDYADVDALLDGD